MNTSLVTTGLSPLTIGSVEVFELSSELNCLPWDLAGGTVTLTIRDPLGNQTIYPATISGFQATVTWQVVLPEGTWTRSWKVIDASGITQVSQPLVFTVTASP